MPSPTPTASAAASSSSTAPAAPAAPSFTLTIIPNTNPAHEIGVKLADGSLGVVSVQDSISPFEPTKLLVTARAHRVSATGLPLKDATSAKVITITPIVKPIERADWTEEAAQAIIAEAAAALALTAAPSV